LTASPAAHRNHGRALVRLRTATTLGAHAGVMPRARSVTVQPQLALFVCFEK
jgi:hypothetical protein